MGETLNRPAVAPAVAPVDSWFSAVEARAATAGNIFSRRRGEDWDPARISPIVTPAQRAARRQADFARLREAEGLTVADAARRLGVHHKTACGYERAREDRLAEGGAVNGVTGRGAVRAASHRDIPRLCGCTWAPALEAGRVAGWLLAFADRSCPFHGAGRPPAPPKRAVTRPGAGRGARRPAAAGSAA
jgi:hypothetical protein